MLPEYKTSESTVIEYTFYVDNIGVTIGYNYEAIVDDQSVPYYLLRHIFEDSYT